MTTSKQRAKDNAMRAIKLIATVPGWYNSLPRMLEKGELTYADLGTTKEDVDQLYVAACKAKAQIALNQLMHGFWGSGPNPCFAEYHGKIWDWLRRANLVLAGNGKLTLADIGTTKEAIEEVMKELRYLHYYNLDSNFPWHEPFDSRLR